MQAALKKGAKLLFSRRRRNQSSHFDSSANMSLRAECVRKAGSGAKTLPHVERCAGISPPSARRRDAADAPPESHWDESDWDAGSLRLLLSMCSPAA